MTLLTPDLSGEALSGNGPLPWRLRYKSKLMGATVDYDVVGTTGDRDVDPTMAVIHGGNADLRVVPVTTWAWFARHRTIELHARMSDPSSTVDLSLELYVAELASDRRSILDWLGLATSTGWVHGQRYEFTTNGCPLFVRVSAITNPSHDVSCELLVRGGERR